MKAVILAGGQGSRLRPLTVHVPKPMIHVMGRPMMEHIVRHLTRFGVKDIVTTLHFKPRIIRDYFQDGAEHNVRMHYTLETEPLGTAGSVKLGQEMLDETFIVVAGDALVDFDFGKFLENHRQSGAKVSLCLKRVKDPGEFGIVITDETGNVKRFLEQPGPSEVFSDTVNTGIYLIEPEVLDRIPPNTPYDFAKDLFPEMLGSGLEINGYIADGYWSDIGTLEQLKQAQWDFLDGKIDLPIEGHLIQEKVWAGNGVKIDENAEIAGPAWLGHDVIVRDGARIGPYCVLGSNVEIDKYASISRAIVNQNSFIGERVDLRGCIVATRNIVEADAEIGEDAVVGAACDLGRNVSIKPGVLVWPEKEIDAHAIVMENLVWESLTRPSAFGSRGISGLGNLFITPEFASVVGKAFGSVVKKGGKVAVSRDNHPFSVLIKRALVSGLLAVGVDVDDLEESTAPVTRFITSHGRTYRGGIHVSQSYHHSQVAVLELYDAQGLPLTRDVRRKVEATMHRGDFPRLSMDLVGHLQYRGRTLERYQDYLLSDLDSDTIHTGRMRVAYYAANRVSARLMSELCEAVGVEFIEFGTVRTEQNLAELERELVKTARLNNTMGLLIHQDSEHLTLVDETGAILTPKRAQELLTAAFIESAPANIPVMLTADQPQYLGNMAQQKKRPAIVSRTEPAALLHEAALQVGQELGWLEFSHFYLGFDAIAAAIRLIEFLATRQLSLNEYHRQIPVNFRNQFRIFCPWDQMGGVRPAGRPGGRATEFPARQGLYHAERRRPRAADQHRIGEQSGPQRPRSGGDTGHREDDRMSALPLFISDLDGTLLPNQIAEPTDGILQRVADTLMALRDDGTTLAYCTGRSLPLAQSVPEQFDLPVPDYWICNVGTEIYFGDGERLDEWSEHLGDTFDANELCAVLANWPALVPQEPVRNGPHKVSFTYPGTATQTQISAWQLAVTKAVNDVQLITSHEVTTGHTLVDFVSIRSGKANACRYLRERHGVTPDQVFFSGDSGNDLDALLSGLLGTLVGNATEAIKLQVRQAGGRVYISDKPYGDGVIDGLRHYGFV